MTIIYILLPISLLLALSAGLAFRWAVNNQQFDDVDSPPIRMLSDGKALHLNPKPKNAEGE